LLDRPDQAEPAGPKVETENRSLKCIFSIDVEDWFHILDLPATPAVETWGDYPSCVEKNFHQLLDLFDKKNTLVTCFFLGWIAEKYPQLVKTAVERGHEIAAHGYSHKLVYQMTEKEFFEDAMKSKNILENIIGRPVLGFRSAGFSTTDRSPWMLDRLIEAGFKYDSSVFPSPRGHGGLKSAAFAPYLACRGKGQIVEFPMTVTKMFGKPTCFFGGGYLRLFPLFLVKKMAARVLSENRPVMFYIHPREIDPNHPRLPMNFKRRFKSYVNLSTTAGKINSLLDKFEFTTFEGFLAGYERLIKEE
jgi:polysaccharide deacetylase family protein (PEP-CTERM system associated)